MRLKHEVAMATVLFTWELGVGLGHMVPMLPLAEGLARQGHRVYVALRDLARASEVFGRAGVSYLQAPFRHSRPGCFRRTPTFSHVLANVGFGDEGELHGLCCAWRNLINFVRPDLIVFDHSPTAMLAARGARVGRVVTGLGFFCPPDVSPFPVLVDGEVDHDRLAAEERRVLERANRLLARWKRPPLERLGQLYGEVDDMFLQTFEELDHYPTRNTGGQAASGTQRYWGPVHAPGGKAPEWPAGNGKRAFAYLKNSPAVGEVLAALADLGGPAIVLSDGIDPAVRKRFASVPNLRFETQRLDMARVRAECDLAVHNANHGTLCQLLLGGKPMLQVPITLEQQVLARRVGQLGAAETVIARGAEARDEIRAKLHAVATDPRYTEAAGRFAKKYSDFDAAEQMERMVARVEELIQTKRGGDGVRGRQGNRETRGQGEGERGKVFAG